MKYLLILMVVVLAVLLMPATLTAQTADPAGVVTEQIAVFKTGDLEAAADYFADDAVYHLNFMDETYTGRDQLLAWWQDLATQNFDIEVEIVNVEGDTVTTRTRTWVDFTRELGIAPLEATEVYVVRDGKIVSGEWTPTEESAAKLQAAMAPPEAMPETGGESFPVYPVLLVLGGLMIAGGFGLLLRKSM